MAAPHVTGWAALWLQRNPNGTPAQLADAIKATATTARVTDPRAGTPNLLLFSGSTSSTPSPAPSPTPTPTPTPSPSLRLVSVSGFMAVSARTATGWKAGVTVTVRDSRGVLVPGAAVTGAFSAGGSSVSCTTATNGQCAVQTANLPSQTAQISYTVRGISGTGLSYDPARALISTITIRRP